MINFGIIGFGVMGKIRYNELTKNINAKIIMISDPDLSRVDKKNVKTTTNYKDILSCSDIDAVFVCTPIFLNYQITKESLESGKHVFCEKPPSLTSSEMIKIQRVEGKVNKKLMYGFNHRHHGSIKKIKEVSVSKNFGRILWMRGRYGKSVDSKFFDNWRSKKSYAGKGILFDQGIHMLDIFLYLVDSFDQAKSFITNTYWNLEIEDNAFVILKNTDKNITASLHSTMTQWRHLFSLEVFFEKGSMILNGLKTTSGSYGDEILTISKNRSLPPKADWDEEQKIIYKKSDFWSSEVQYFVNSIINDTVIQNGNSSDALKIMLLLEKIYKDSNNE